MTESFEPLLDLYLAHPTWGTDIELQGLMIEVIEQRHPRVLAKLDTLTDRRQVELVSFHYSDQLFLAYPSTDMEWSQELNHRAFDRAGLPISPVVFTQEGQFGEGMLAFMLPRGYRIALLPKNLLRHQHPSFDQRPEPYYETSGALVVVAGKGLSRPDLGLEIVWTFFNDGELLATNDLNPYAGTLFVHTPETVARHEQEIASLETQGFRIETISRCVEAIENAGIPPSPLPPILDGTWQPDDTGNLFRWMGGSGVFADDEADNTILTGNYRLRKKVLAADVLAGLLPATANEARKAEALAALDEAKRALLLAEVSDSTGWNPWAGEIRYSREWNAKGGESAERAIGILSDLLGQPVAVDTSARTAVNDFDESDLEAADPPVPVEIPAESRPGVVHAFSVDGRKNLWDIRVEFHAGSVPPIIYFPRSTDRLAYSPTLQEDIVRDVPLSAFGFGSTAIPLANGLIGLGDDLFLIQDAETIHVAAQIGTDLPWIRFEDRTAPHEPVTWVFRILKGTPEEALREADRLNVHPRVQLRPSPDDDGGLCTALPHPSGSTTQALLALLMVALSGMLKRWKRLRFVSERPET